MKSRTGLQFKQLLLALARALANMAGTKRAPRITAMVDCFAAARAAGAQQASLIQQCLVQYDLRGKWTKELAKFCGPHVGKVEVVTGGGKFFFAEDMASLP